jgi:hypothetical protein
MNMIHRQPIIDTHVHLWDLKHPELKWVWLEKDAIHPILGNIDAIKSVAYTLNDLVRSEIFRDSWVRSHPSRDWITQSSY